MTEQNTAWLLAQWAMWQREGVVLRLNEKSLMAAYPQTACGSRGYSEICDDDAMRIDAVMARLKLDKPDYFKILFLSFVRGLNATQIGARLGVSRYMAVKEYEAAYVCVEGIISAD